MAVGTSLLLIAIGAVLAIAVNYQVQGLDVNAVGVILIVIGVIGLLYSSLFLASFAPMRDRHGHYEDRRSHDHY